jgi:hypothetical protein
VFQLNQHTSIEQFTILQYNLQTTKLSGGGAIVLLALESSAVVVMYHLQYGFYLMNDGRQELVICHLEVI